MENKRELVAKIEKHIQAGGVVLAEKTKSVANGGKHLVSAGRYRTAVPDPRRTFAVLYTGRRPEAHHDSYHTSAWAAAQEFVTFCGVEITRNATFRK